MSKGTSIKIAAVAALAAVVAMTLGSASAQVYVSGGTVVFKQEGAPPAADNGTLACHSSGIGVGGACLPFTPGGFVGVTDVLAGKNVAFQVCIDANGDGICTDGKRDTQPCRDQIFFSHDDQGLFHNPIGPLPTAMPAGCGTTAPWKGYVVFLCEGVHVTRGSAGPGAPHTHTATTGTIANTGPLAPSGFGDFCGAAGGERPVSKPYTVIG